MCGNVWGCVGMCEDVLVIVLPSWEMVLPVEEVFVSLLSSVVLPSSLLSVT